MSGLTDSSMLKGLRPAATGAVCMQTVLRALFVCNDDTEQVMLHVVACAKSRACQLQNEMPRFCLITILAVSICDANSEALSRGCYHGGPLPRPVCMHV